MEELKRRLNEHLNEDALIHQRIFDGIRNIQEAQHLVNINHLPHIEGSVAELVKSISALHISQTKTQTDTEWTKKILFMVLGAVIVGVAGLFFGLFQSKVGG